MANVAPPIANPRYYLANFHQFVDFIDDLYQDLLIDEEREFLDRFRALSQSAQCLFVRIQTRRGPIYRGDRFQYAEIDNIDAAFVELKANELIAAVDHSHAELLPLLTVAELKQCIKHSTVRGNKRGLIEWLLNHGDPDTIHNVLHQARFFQLLPKEILRRFRLLFFGNLYQDLSEFVIEELGHVSYEPYALNRRNRYFHTREDLDFSLDCYAIREYLEEHEKTMHSEELLALCWQLPLAGQAKLQRRRDRVVNRIGRQLERLDCLDMALSVYRASSSAPCRERSTRILLKQQRKDEAETLCREIDNAPMDEEEALFARRSLDKLEREKNPKLPRPDRFSPNTESRCIPSNGDLSVELLARDLLAMEHSQVEYVENELINGLFGLCFWDAIFSPVEGAFCNRFQRGPVDLFDNHFYSARKEIVDTLMMSLYEPDFLERMGDVYQCKAGIANHFVNWRRLDWPLLELALKRMPARHLESIFRRMLRDLRANRSGFPDLICFDENSYSLVEIKGPGDRPQANQLRWLEFFANEGIEAKILNIEWE